MRAWIRKAKTGIPIDLLIPHRILRCSVYKSFALSGSLSGPFFGIIINPTPFLFLG
jgi:hypothetical protein